MSVQWAFVPPVAGLLLFAFVTYQSASGYRTCYRYWWWSATPLDSDPLDRRHGVGVCDQFHPMSVDKYDGQIASLLKLSAIPSFIVGWFIVDGLGHWGISQVLSFLVSMPLLIAGWFYLLGWLVDRGIGKLLAAASLTSSPTNS